VRSNSLLNNGIASNTKLAINSFPQQDSPNISLTIDQLGLRDISLAAVKFLDITAFPLVQMINVYTVSRCSNWIVTRANMKDNYGNTNQLSADWQMSAGGDSLSAVRHRRSWWVSAAVVASSWHAAVLLPASAEQIVQPTSTNLEYHHPIPSPLWKCTTALLFLWCTNNIIANHFRGPARAISKSYMYVMIKTFEQTDDVLSIYLALSFILPLSMSSLMNKVRSWN